MRIVFRKFAHLKPNSRKSEPRRGSARVAIGMKPTAPPPMRMHSPLPVLWMLLAAFSVMAQAQNDGSRQISLEEFTRARPTSSLASTKTRGSGKVDATRARLSQYKRVTPQLAAALKSIRLTGAEIGVTVWRLRPSRPEDDAGARLLVMRDDEKTQWTPERIEADTPLKVGDRVRISIEVPRAGYLYVVDREQYADGSFGDAYLIFPTTRTRGGDNRVKPGKLIDIPSQEDDPHHFTLVPSPSRSDQVAEVLSFIVTAQPLPGLPITDKPLHISNSDIEKWEKNWSSEIERFELEGGAGRPWTAAERAASSEQSAKLLTQQEPLPQTVYRIASKKGTSVLVTVPLLYGKRPTQ
jgi:Domain of unknown function (DUF4384)